MILFQYLDKLPKVPDQFIDTLLKLEFAPHGAVRGEDGAKSAKRFKLSSEIEDWLNKNIINVPGYAEKYSSVRMFIPNSEQAVLTPHTDTRRKWAISFALDTGGDNTYTNFYLEPGNMLARDLDIIWEQPRELLLNIHKVKIEKFRWHVLNTHVLHDITGLDTPRKMLTIGSIVDDPLSIIKGYCVG